MDATLAYRSREAAASPLYRVVLDHAEIFAAEPLAQELSELTEKLRRRILKRMTALGAVPDAAVAEMNETMDEMERLLAKKK